MKSHIYIFFLLLSILNGCTSEEEVPQFIQPDIIVIPSHNAPYIIDENILFEIKLRADINYGIKSLEVFRKGLRILEKNGFSSNSETVTFNYTTSINDWEQKLVNLEFVIKDHNGKEDKWEFPLSMEMFYEYTFTDFFPDGSWDLVKNENIIQESDGMADIVLNPDPAQNRTFFNGANGTVFFKVTREELNFEESGLSVSLVKEVLKNKEPRDNMIVYSSDDFFLPIVAKIRGQEDYVLIDVTNRIPRELSYRKTSKDAGIQ